VCDDKVDMFAYVRASISHVECIHFLRKHILRFRFNVNVNVVVVHSSFETVFTGNAMNIQLKTAQS